MKLKKISWILSLFLGLALILPVQAEDESLMVQIPVTLSDTDTNTDAASSSQDLSAKIQERILAASSGNSDLSGWFCLMPEGNAPDPEKDVLEITGKGYFQIEFEEPGEYTYTLTCLDSEYTPSQMEITVDVLYEEDGELGDVIVAKTEDGAKTDTVFHTTPAHSNSQSGTNTNSNANSGTSSTNRDNRGTNNPSSGSESSSGVSSASESSGTQTNSSQANPNASGSTQNSTPANTASDSHAKRYIRYAALAAAGILALILLERKNRMSAASVKK